MRFVTESKFECSVEELFAFHERPDAFALLQPPWEQTKIIKPPASLEVGTQVVLKTRVAPLVWLTIEAEHVAYKKNEFFEDVMNRGPFAFWHHRHLFLDDPDGSRLRDDIEYRLPLGPLGRLADPLMVRGRLEKLFKFRHEVTRRHVEANGDP